MEKIHLNPGPSRREDGEQTRESLMDAAEELFAERGFHGTSIRDIIDEAGCNIAAVNYHFKGKENLYYEVTGRRLAARREVLLAHIQDTMEDSEDLPDLKSVLASYAQEFIEPVADPGRSRYILQLFSRELLDPHFQPELLFGELVEPVQDALIQAINAVCPGCDLGDLRVYVQLFVGQLIHLLHMNAYFGPERCSQLSFSISPEAIEKIVKFTSAGIEHNVFQEEDFKCR